MQLHTPPALKQEHEALHARLAQLARKGGRVGEAAEVVEKIMHPHILKEEEYALPPLALLPEIAQGRSSPEMLPAVALTEKLRSTWPQILAEHVALLAALNRLATVAREEQDEGSAQLAEMLKWHTQMEEEILYPAALLVGEYLKSGVPKP